VDGGGGGLAGVGSHADIETASARAVVLVIGADPLAQSKVAPYLPRSLTSITKP
jgi:hypothetical protein